MLRGATALLFLWQTGCGAPPRQRQADEQAFLQAQRLYEQLSDTYPMHSAADFEHQLLVREEDPAFALQALDLRPGMMVADVGCGSGFYSFHLARALGPEGRLWAVDMQQAALDRLSERLQDPDLNPHQNVRPHRNQADDLLLPAESLDLAFMGHLDFYAYPQLLPENQRMLRSVLSALRPGATLAVLQDMGAVEGATTELVRRNFTEQGFVFRGQLPDPRNAGVLFLFERVSGTRN